MKVRAIDSENRNRRNCLEFDRISEDPEETTEIIEKKLNSIFKTNLNLDTDKISIERCHRISSSFAGKSRTIIVRFLSFKSRQLVWSNRKKLKGTNVYMNESYAGEIKLRWKILWPYVRNARKLGSKAFLAVDKLIIDGKKYTFDKIEEIPKIYRSSHTIAEGNTVSFFTKNSPLSNFHACQISMNDVMYTSAEQCYAHQAAIFFGDADSAETIMSQKEPYDHKKSFRKIKGFNKEIWYKDKAVDVMKTVLVAKFSQNKELGQLLKNTEDKVIGEANPTEFFLGIGLSLWNKDAKDKTLWTGDNNMGKLLMEVRSII